MIYVIAGVFLNIVLLILLCGTDIDFSVMADTLQVV